MVLKSFLDTSQNIKKLNLEFNELFSQGTELIAAGLKNSISLTSLNLRGNAIHDEGLEFLAEALSENHTLEELDISMNEITQNGILTFAEVLPTSSIKTLNLSKNLLGDDSLIYLAENMRRESNKCVLERIDLSSSRIGDNGILFFLEKTENCENLKYIKAIDNFISEKIEKIMIDILERNKNLVEFAVHGNRLSVCCLNRIKKVLMRNKKEQEDQEPNKLKTEIYRLKYEQKKILMAKERLKEQEKVN